MESLVLKNVDTGRETEVKADGLFLFVGMVPQTGLVKDMVDCDKAGYIKVNEKMETNVPGLYAAGRLYPDIPASGSYLGGRRRGGGSCIGALC